MFEHTDRLPVLPRFWNAICRVSICSMTMTRAMPPKGDDDALLVEGNVLTAMALMIALSAPAERDTMIAVGRELPHTP